MRKYSPPAYNQGVYRNKKEAKKGARKDEISVRIAEGLWQNRKTKTIKKLMKKGQKFYIN